MNKATQTFATNWSNRDRTVIDRHIRKVFDEGELDRQSNVQNLHIANSDKPVSFYNLDVIIPVGYRVKSPEGVHFRQWAKRLLREHLTRGYTLNRQRFEANNSCRVNGKSLTALLEALLAIFVMMPDAKNDNCFRMSRIPNNVISEHCITHDIGFRCQRHVPAQLREETNIFDTGDEFCSNTRRCRWVFLGNECPETNQIGNCFFRVDQPH